MNDRLCTVPEFGLVIAAAQTFLFTDRDAAIRMNGAKTDESRSMSFFSRLYFCTQYELYDHV